MDQCVDRVLADLGPYGSSCALGFRSLGVGAYDLPHLRHSREHLVAKAKT